MAGFRIGRGRAGRPGPAQQNGGYGGSGYRGSGSGGYGSSAGHAQPPYRGQQPPAPTGRPEYFDAPAPRYDDAPGHTQAFTIGETPDAYGSPYGDQGYADGGYGDHRQGTGDGGYGDGNVATYRAGQSSGPPAGPRLRWQDLLAGIALRPGRTFWQMRDYQVWGPALIVTFGYGLLAVFGFDSARKDVLNSAFSNSLPWVLTTAVAVVLMGLMTGAVTHALARQFGGDGGWAPTIGLSMLITSLTDAPRLLFALFLGGGNGLVQVLGWATWLACAALLTSMVSKSHDLPWQKALGASSVQLLALLVLFKLPTL